MRPVATDDLFSFVRGAPIGGNLLANDSDDNGRLFLRAFDHVKVAAKSNGPQETVVQGKYGTFTVKPDGTFSYVLDESNPLVAALRPGATLTEELSYKISDGSGLTDTGRFAMQIHGAANGPAVIGGQSEGSIAEDVDVDGFGELQTSATLSIADPDVGQSSFMSQPNVVGEYGTFSLAANGAWTYAAANNQQDIQALGAGHSVTDAFTAVSSDGSASQVVTVTINGTNDAALIGGISTALIAEGDATDSAGNLRASGALSIADADVGQSVFVAQTSIAGTYGTFTLTEEGAWTYAASADQSAIRDLVAGQSIVDSFVAASFDGSASKTVEVTINGADEGGAASGQALLDWHHIMLEAIRLDGSNPAYASRVLAIESVAVYDVLNALNHTQTYLVNLAAPDGASADAAVASAAHAVLKYLFPVQGSDLDAKLALSLGSIADVSGRDLGADFGASVAAAIIAIRDHDGWDDFVVDNGGSEPGQWRPTAPVYAPGMAPQWADLAPFSLTDGSQFRPEAPPELDSAEYAAALHEVQTLGSATGSSRTADQTQIARFWADGGGTYTPGGHWNDIAAQVVTNLDLGAVEMARALAMLNVSLADAGIAAWDSKYAYDLWRPITAIHDAEFDDNAATLDDDDWQPLLITPPFPEYVSGHSTYSAAAAAVLTSLFGDDYAFSSTSSGLLGVTRNFDSFWDAASEAGRSRIYGGLHYEFSNQGGQTLGAKVGNWVLDQFSTTEDSAGPKIIIDQAAGLVDDHGPTISGYALDNMSGVEQLLVSLDGGAATAVTIGADGRFSLPSGLAADGSDDGSHVLVFSANDHAGNAANAVAFDFILDTVDPIIDLKSLLDGDALTPASRLSGTVNGTGSDIVALTYQIDNGPAVPISFNPATGAFDTALALSPLSAGDHLIRMTATDAAGHSSVLDRGVGLGALIPFTILEVNPKDGTGEVGATFRPYVSFSRAVDVSTLTAQSLFLSDATGATIPTKIVPASDGLSAWLFVEGTLPGGSTIKVHVDGGAIRAAADGAALDADMDGTAGGDLETSFTTVSLSTVPGTSVTGFVVGPGVDLKPMTFDDMRAGPDGVIRTADDAFLERIANARVWILGLEDQAVFTDAQGNFTLTDVPTGNVKLAIDGRTATNAPDGAFFPEMVMDLNVRPGIANTVMGSMGTLDQQLANLHRGEVYLPRIPTSIFQTVSDTGTTEIDLPAVGASNITPEQRSEVKLVVTGGSLVDADGNILTNAQVGISTVPPELVREMLPPGLLQHTFDITIQAPDAAVFTTPAQLTLPNIFNSAPGTKLNFLSFDHTTGRLVIEGTATVSADGLSVTTDPGTGITKPGWHGLTPPGTPTEGPEEPPPPCEQENVTFEEYVKIAEAATVGLKNVLVELGKVGPIVNAALDAALNIRTLIKEVIDLFNVSDGADKYAVAKERFEAADAARAVAKQAVEVAIEGVKTGVISKGKAVVAGTEGTINTAIETLEALRDPECPNPSLIGALAALRATSFTISNVKNTINLAENLVEKIAIKATFAAIDKIFDSINFIIKLGELNNRTNEQIVEFSLVSNDDDRALEDIYSPKQLNELREHLKSAQELLPTFLIELEEGGVFAAAVAGIGDIIDVSVDAASSASIFLISVAGLPANAPYLIEGSDFALRGFTDGSGGIDAFLPSEVALTISIYDHELGIWGRAEFITETSGAITKLPLPVFAGLDGEVDSDADGLADIAEHTVGTSASLADTDGDGVSDGSELDAGTNPLDGLLVTTGILSSVDFTNLSGGAASVGRALVIEGPTAFVALGTAGLAIVNIAKAFSPTVSAIVALPGNARDVAIDTTQEVAAVATETGGLVFVDVSNPAAPVVIRTIPGNAIEVEIVDSVAFAAIGSTLQAIDVASGDVLQVLNLPAGTTIVDVVHEGNMLYVADSSATLRIYEANAGILVLRGSASEPSLAGLAGTDRQLFVADGVLYIPTTNGFNGGFATVDVSDPTAPTLISNADDTSLAGTAIALNGSGLGILVGNPGGAFGQNALDIVRTDDAANTGDFVTRVVLASTPNAVVIGNGLAFVATADGKLQVVNYLPFDAQGVAPTVALNSVVADLDPVTDGLQVQEGQTIPFGVTVTDDVQVRTLELLVNGEAARLDSSYPFDLRAALPTIAANGGETVTLQVRATDTGGNVGLSQLVTIELVPDIVGPSLVTANITDGALVGPSFRTFRATFSEPIRDDVLTNGAFTLIDAEGNVIAPISTLLRDGGRTVQFTVAALEVGDYIIRSSWDLVRDLAGNSLGNDIEDTHFTIGTFSVEWASESGGDWFANANWNTGSVPGVDDDVFIGLPATETVALAFGTPVSILGLNSSAIVALNFQQLDIENDATTAGLLVTNSSSFSTRNATIGSLDFGGGTFAVNNSATIGSSFAWSGGTIDGAGT
ncbi:hypothetical protein CO655_21460, partial [Rhizobium sp. M1]